MPDRSRRRSTRSRRGQSPSVLIRATRDIGSGLTFSDHHVGVAPEPVKTPTVATTARLQLQVSGVVFFLPWFSCCFQGGGVSGRG